MGSSCIISVTITFLVIICTINTSSTCSCCLRTEPPKALNDGLYLYTDLVLNTNEEFSYLPTVLNSPTFEVIYSSLNIIKNYSYEVTGKSGLSVVLDKLMVALKLSLYAYLSEMFNLDINYYDEDRIETLISMLEVYKNAVDLSIKVIPSLNGHRGSAKNRFAYWKEHVEKTCMTDTCPRLNEIRNRVIRFPPKSDQCIC